MIKSKLSYYLDSLFLTTTGIIVIMGSVGIFKNYCVPLALTTIFIYMGAGLILKKRFNFPKLYGLFIAFNISILIHNFFFNGKTIYFWMFLSGGLYWLIFYNIRLQASKYLVNFLFFLGLLMLLIFTILRVKGITYMSPDNLFLPLTNFVLHNHLGDLWAIILIISFYKNIQQRKTVYTLLIIFGILAVSISLSRSAVAELITGGIYILYKTVKPELRKKYLFFVLTISSILFISFSVYKSTLMARPFFLEAARSLFRAPYGLGMGNFNKVSTESNVVHNIVLEVMSGMGAYSILFLIWLIIVIKRLLFDKINIEFGTIFLALFINFFFDSTYVIPGMIWIWFICLALL